MRRSQKSEVRSQTLVILIFLFFSFLIINHKQSLPSAIAERKSLIINQVFAQEASDSATPSGSLLQKLNAIKTEIASKAAQLKFEVNKKIQNKALVGFAKDKTTTQITLDTKNGDKTVVISDYTLFESKARKPSLDDLDKNDYIAAIGDIDDKGNLVGKKIIWLSKPTNTKTFFWGYVQSISFGSWVIKNKNGGKVTLNLSSNAQFGMGTDEASISDFKVGNLVGGLGVAGDKGVINADYIYLISSASAKPIK